MNFKKVFLYGLIPFTMAACESKSVWQQQGGIIVEKDSVAKQIGISTNMDTIPEYRMSFITDEGYVFARDFNRFPMYKKIETNYLFNLLKVNDVISFEADKLHITVEHPGEERNSRIRNINGMILLDYMGLAR